MSNKQIDFILQKAVADMGIPGVIAMIANEAEVLYEAAFGQIGKGSRQAMTLETVFWIASMTKPITTVAALQLIFYQI